MPTNVVHASTPLPQGNVFQTIGPGMQGLAALLAGTMGDNKGGGGRGAAIPIPETVDPNTIDLGDLGNLQNPSVLKPQPLGVPPPDPDANPFAMGASLPKLGAPRPGGIAGLLPQQFPGLFPGYGQYGGL